MRQKRAKTYKRVMALYTQTFGFRTPFQMLVSQDIMLKCPAELNLMKALHSCVQAETKFMITQCCMEALYKLGKEYQEVTNLAKRFERRRCNHREAIDPDACLKDTIGPNNKHNYVLAAQSASLRQSLSNVPGLPIIHFNPRQVLVLSPPSIATTRQKNRIEEERRLEGEKGMEVVEDGDNVIGATTPGASGSGSSNVVKGDVTRGASGRKKIKGPNPLSVKRKKTEKIPRDENQDREGEAEDGDPDAVEAVDDHEGDGGEGGKRRKKRKRGKGKSAVAEARAELIGELQAPRSVVGAVADSAAGSGDEDE